MNKELLLLFLIMHVFLDFYVQSANLMKSKERRYRRLLSHSFIYFDVLMIPYIVFGFRDDLLLVALIIGISHLMIDTIKYSLMQDCIYTKVKHKDRFTSILFIGDQLMHLIIITTSVYHFFEPTMPDDHVFISIAQWILLILLLMKPSNMIFKIIFGSYKPSDSDPYDQEELQTRKVGAKIGALERILMVVCIATGQYTAMGLIITAKSVARYDKISHNTKFAEYYLLGTFSSILLTISWYLICIEWLQLI